jgi:hypothetical protein
VEKGADCSLLWRGVQAAVCCGSLCRLQPAVERFADCSLLWSGAQTAVCCGEVCRVQSVV